MAEIRSSQLWEFRPSREMLEKRYQGYLDKLEREPRNAEVLVMAGHTAMSLEYFDKAAAHFEAALAVNPSLPGLPAALDKARKKMGLQPKAAPPPKDAPSSGPGFKAEDTSNFFAPQQRGGETLLRKPPPAFGDVAPGAFAFGFSGTAVLVVLMATAVWYGTGFVMRALTLFVAPMYVVVRGYLFGYYMEIVRDTAADHERRVALPGVAHVTGDFFTVVFSSIAAFLIALAGVGILAGAYHEGYQRAKVLYVDEGDRIYRRDPVTHRPEEVERSDLRHLMIRDAFNLADSSKTGPGMVLVFLGVVMGGLYLPIALLACLHFHTVGAAFRYLLCWKTVFRTMPHVILPWFLAVAATLTFWGAAVAGLLISDRATAIGAEVGLMAVTVYLEIVFCRIVGLIELCNVKRIGWV